MTAYTESMQHALLEYRGSFRYADQDALDRALGEVRDHLSDEEAGEPDQQWMKYLWRRGMTLHVEALLPATADRQIAAAVVGALARGAVEGCVHMRRGNHLIDEFVSDDLD